MIGATGIMALADYLDIPELYESYGDTHTDRLKNYNMYLDPIKMVGNTISDLVSFPVDLAGDVPAAVIDRVLHDPFFKEGLLTDYGDYFKDSVRANTLGIPYKIEDNPLNPKIAEGVNADITKMVDDHYAKELKRLGDADNDGYLDIAEDYATENTPSYGAWAYQNPEAEDDTAYNEMLNKNYMKKYEEIFPEDERRDFVKKTADSVYQTRYGINDPYLDQNQAILGPGLREFDLEGINVPFTDKYDIPFQYGGGGDPPIPYSNEQAEKTYRKLNIAGDIGYGIPSALKFLFKRGAKKTKSGTKDFRGDSGSFNYKDYMSEPKKYRR
tara:strand:+ start:81 stop:1061 length:981 start_codon:yes stop_codon:yes gene_type:complete